MSLDNYSAGVSFETNHDKSMIYERLQMPVNRIGFLKDVKMVFQVFQA